MEKSLNFLATLGRVLFESLVSKVQIKDANKKGGSVAQWSDLGI